MKGPVDKHIKLAVRAYSYVQRVALTFIDCQAFLFGVVCIDSLALCSL